LAEEAGAVRALAGGGEVGGLLDLVAEEQAGGQVGDEGVPGVSVDVGEVAEVVAVVAGEGAILSCEFRIPIGEWSRKRDWTEHVEVSVPSALTPALSRREREKCRVFTAVVCRRQRE
jgi:hypothetical protein